jgi:hypothetical protein
MSGKKKKAKGVAVVRTQLKKLSMNDPIGILVQNGLLERLRADVDAFHQPLDGPDVANLSIVSKGLRNMVLAQTDTVSFNLPASREDAAKCIAFQNSLPGITKMIIRTDLTEVECSYEEHIRKAVARFRMYLTRLRGTLLRRKVKDLHLAGITPRVVVPDLFECLPDLASLATQKFVSYQRRPYPGLTRWGIFDEDHYHVDDYDYQDLRDGEVDLVGEPNITDEGFERLVHLRLFNMQVGARCLRELRRLCPALRRLDCDMLAETEVGALTELGALTHLETLGLAWRCGPWDINPYDYQRGANIVTPAALVNLLTRTAPQLRVTRGVVIVRDWQQLELLEMALGLRSAGGERRLEPEGLVVFIYAPVVNLPPDVDLPDLPNLREVCMLEACIDGGSEVFAVAEHLATIFPGTRFLRVYAPQDQWRADLLASPPSNPLPPASLNLGFPGLRFAELSNCLPSEDQSVYTSAPWRHTQALMLALMRRFSSSTVLTFSNTDRQDLTEMAMITKAFMPGPLPMLEPWMWGKTYAARISLQVVPMTMFTLRAETRK